MKQIKLILISAIILITSTAKAQDAAFEEFLLGGKKDANILLGHYMQPFLKGMGYGFNNGWYNTAKPHETLGFDITLAFNAAIVPDVDQSFEFIPSEYEFTRIQSGPNILPTFAGTNSSTILENFADQQDLNPSLPPGEVVVGSYGAPEGVGDQLTSFGLNKVVIPSPIIQAGIGIIKGTEIKIRWMPTVNTDEFSFKYFGIGGIHSISQWIPAFKDMPFLDISGFVGWTTVKAEYAIPPGSIDGSNQTATFEVQTTTFQLLASANVSVITGYVGLGIDNFKSTFKMNGEYKLYPAYPEFDLVDPINLEEKGTGGFRTTVGARLKLAIITIHADYTFREYNTLTVGLGFSVR
jgi:hypothetical protein